MSQDELKEIQRRLAVVEERTERFDRIYQEWVRIEEWIKSLPEFSHLRSRSEEAPDDGQA